MREDIRARLASCRVVSFDIFDTLVLRRLERPVDVFALVARRYKAAHGPLPLDFPRVREEAEAACRREAWAATKAEEITFEGLYDFLVRRCGLPARAAVLLKELEIAAEIEVAVPNPAAKEFFEECLAAGKTVVLTSDMYLPEAAVRAILESCGYAGYHRLYLSSAHGRTKSSGALYHLPREELGCRFEDMLHLGDNADSDHVAATKLGVNSAHLPKPRERAEAAGEFGRLAFTEIARRDFALEIAAYKGHLINVAQAGLHARDLTEFWYALGYKTAGILFYGFIDWLRQRLKADGISRVFFLSRDGHIYHRLFDLMCAMRGDTSFHTSYLYASRRALNFAAITRLEPADLHFLISGSSRLTAAQYLERIGLDGSAHAEAIRRAGFAGSEVVEGIGFKRLDRLFRDLEPELLEAAAAEREILAEYLEAEGFFSQEHVAVVDIGWHGTLQDSLDRLSRCLGKATVIHGYYLGTFSWAGERARRMPMTGYLCHLGQPAYFNDIIGLSIEIFETLHVAPHGSVIRFRREGGRAVPVLDDNAFERPKVEYARRMHQGVADFFQDFDATAAGMKLKLVPEVSAEPLHRLLQNPTDEELRRLGDIPHADGFGDIYQTRCLAKPPSYLQAVLRPLRFREEYRKSFWKRGFLLRRRRLLPLYDAYKKAKALVRGKPTSQHRMSRQKICIVTPDLVGPLTNGGIGTHCHALARYLASFEDCEVHILFVNNCEREDVDHWKRHFVALNITFAGLDALPKLDHPVLEDPWFIARSVEIYRYLQARQFDVIHFQDWLGAGYASIQAKRTGRAFAGTLLTVTMHSPTQWHHQGMERWSKNPEEEIRLTWCERYACREADVLVSVSDYMLGWAEKNHWQLAADHRHLPCCYRPDPELAAMAAPEVDAGHLVFFGRLETRKGLELFCQAVQRALEARPGCFRKLSFLGKAAEVRGVPSLDYIGQAFAAFPDVEITIKTDLDTFQALGYIKSSGGVVVLPSLIDNSPYTVIECISYGLPFLAADSGGIPELAAPEVLFAPTAEALAERLAGLEAMGWASLAHPYSNERAEALWRGFHEEHRPVKTRPLPTARPRVSVCMPHFNHARYLPEALASLAAQDYPDFEVIVVDDGSTDPESVRVFAEMRAAYPAWTFVSGPRQGVRSARNEAVRRATGEFVTFFDSDNVAEPFMLSRQVAGLLASGCDCVACHYVAYADGPDIGLARNPLYGFFPLGSCPEYGFLFNVFGDTNFIMRRQDFLDQGGFRPADPAMGYEDWEFLAGLCLSGKTLEVVPEPLFRYRYRPDSFNSLCHRYASWKGVLDRYYAHDPFLGFLVTEMVIPLHEMGKTGLRKDPGWDVAHLRRHAVWLEEQLDWCHKERQQVFDSRTYRLGAMLRDAVRSPKKALLLPARLVFLVLPEKVKRRLRPLLGRK